MKKCIFNIKTILWIFPSNQPHRGIQWPWYYVDIINNNMYSRVVKSQICKYPDQNHGDNSWFDSKKKRNCVLVIDYNIVLIIGCLYIISTDHGCVLQQSNDIFQPSCVTFLLPFHSQCLLLRVIIIVYINSHVVCGDLRDHSRAATGAAAYRSGENNRDIRSSSGVWCNVYILYIYARII